MEVLRIGSTFLTIQIVFADRSAISKDIREPDTLVVLLKTPQIFVDAETGEAFESEQLKFSIKLGSQMSKA